MSQWLAYNNLVFYAKSGQKKSSCWGQAIEWSHVRSGERFRILYKTKLNETSLRTMGIL
jgi:hypothetical protein